MVTDDKVLDNFLQASNSFAQLGMSHILLLSYSQGMCEAINAAVPDIGCAWSSDTGPPDLQDVAFCGVFDIELLQGVFMTDKVAGHGLWQLPGTV